MCARAGRAAVTGSVFVTVLPVGAYRPVLRLVWVQMAVAKFATSRSGKGRHQSRTPGGARCRHAQGYHVARPLDEAGLLQLVRAAHRVDHWGCMASRCARDRVVHTGPVTDAPSGDDDRPLRRMEAGDPYIVDDEIAGMHLRAVTLTEAYNATPAADPEGRRRILEELLAGIGPETVIRAPFHCDYGVYCSIGARTFVNFGLVILDVARVTIGDDVQIGPNVQLLTATHPVDADRRRAKWEAAEPIIIEDNVWLGGGVIVLPGVTIGEDTVVGAGAVVNRDLPAGVVAVGSPARIVRVHGR